MEESKRKSVKKSIVKKDWVQILEEFKQTLKVGA
jgi:hypothetical protein